MDCGLGSPVARRLRAVAWLAVIAAVGLQPALAASPDGGGNAAGRVNVAGGIVRFTGAVVVGTMAAPVGPMTAATTGRSGVALRTGNGEPARTVRFQHLRPHELSAQLNLLQRAGERLNVRDEAVVTYE